MTPCVCEAMEAKDTGKHYKYNTKYKLIHSWSCCHGHPRCIILPQCET